MLIYVVGHDRFLSTLPLRLVSLSALARANHPFLTHRSHYSPSTQVALLTCLDAPIISIAGRWPCCVHRSTLDDGTQAPSSGPQGRRNGNPPILSTQRHAHIERHSEAHHRGAYYRRSSLPFVGAPPPRCSIKCLAYSRAFRQSPDYLALLQTPSPIIAARSLVLAGLLLALDFFARPVILAPPMADQSSAKNFFARARAKSSETNKASVNGEVVQKELQEATKRNYRRDLKLWDQ